jgi:phage terminase small subunit
MMFPKLTPKQEKFCLLYIEFGDASAAYRGAYSSGKMKATTINRNAHELLKDSKISARIAELQKKVAEKAELTAAWVIERLQRNARICLGEEKIKLSVLPKGADKPVEVEAHDRDPAAANKALELLGKTMGIFVERVETTNEQFVVGVDKPMTEDSFERKYKMGMAASAGSANRPH